MLLQKLSYGRPSFLILFKGVAAVIRARDRMQFVGHFRRIECLMQTHRLLIGNKKILVSVDRENRWDVLTDVVMDETRFAISSALD